MRETRMTSHISGKKFSSPFLGTCFQYIIFADDWEIYEEFSSPFSGTFFSTEYPEEYQRSQSMFSSPFSGTFFSKSKKKTNGIGQSWFSSPFSGTFFSIVSYAWAAGIINSFRPLSRGPFFQSVPAKPQPVCSRKRIRGGDGRIASSGTLLQR